MGFILKTVHDGTDWAVVDATAEDRREYADCIFETLGEALGRGRELCEGTTARLWDFSTEPEVE